MGKTLAAASASHKAAVPDRKPAYVEAPSHRSYEWSDVPAVSLNPCVLPQIILGVLRPPARDQGKRRGIPFGPCVVKLFERAAESLIR